MVREHKTKCKKAKKRDLVTAWEIPVYDMHLHLQQTQVGRAAERRGTRAPLPPAAGHPHPPLRAQSGCYSPCTGKLNSKQASNIDLQSVRSSVQGSQSTPDEAARSHSTKSRY
jgi:hypothetical protein